jgi:formylglycine-generating enzyme required for sulfatase activity
MSNPTIDVEALQRQIAALQAQLAAVSPAPTISESADEPSIVTDGGAAVQGSVEVFNGHFIGRDFVHVVNRITKAGEDPEEAKSVIALYLHALAADLAGLKLGEIDTAADQTRKSPLQLADIYVPLDTNQQIPQDATLAEWLARERQPLRDGIETQRETRPVSALEALAEHSRLTLLGKPGSGKSTFGASVLLALAQAWQGHADELSKLGAQWTHGPLLPIRVILRRFAEQLPAGEQPARAGDLWAFIGRELEAAGHGLSADVMNCVQRIARKHGALILFDGLDECGDRARRERVMAAVDELMRGAGPKSRFVLTARPYAWPTGPDPAASVYALADLDDKQIEQFIAAWYAALVKRNWLSPGEGQRKREDLMQARQRPDLLPLARNPLLLTLMATLHTNRGRMPDDRADLYNESVELLLLRWNRQTGADKALLDELAVPGLKLSDLREVLEELAFRVHEQNVGREGTADIGEDRLGRAFRSLLNNSKDKADIVVNYIEKRAGLLLGQGEKDGERQFTFPHRTFQEFLAASHLAAHPDFPAECARLARSAPAHWQVVLSLAARLAKAERGASAADELIGGLSIAETLQERRPASADYCCARLAAMQLLEIGLGSINKGNRTRAIATRVAGWLCASLPLHPDDGGEPAVQRAQAGDLLAALGDPRFDAQRLCLPADDELGFVRIAADHKFRIGTRSSHWLKVPDYEINDELSPTREFYIARYPVTIAQFEAFINATGFKIGDTDALRDTGIRPVRYVNWREAVAYCDWLTSELGRSSTLANSPIARLVREQGWRVTLPSELEWEKASRGGRRDEVFSWGDEDDPERANYRDTGIGDTSAVGCFPANGYGLQDMIGNVWEWTRSKWAKYPYDPNDAAREDLTPDETDRVARGGSWNLNRVGVRCAVRLMSHPVMCLKFLGFRVVLRAAPVLHSKL